jgi:hypothetical protein
VEMLLASPEEVERCKRKTVCWCELLVAGAATGRSSATPTDEIRSAMKRLVHSERVPAGRFESPCLTDFA